MDELRYVDIEKVEEDVARISAYFDFMKEHLKIFQKTEREIKRGKKKVVRTRFDLNPEQEWIQAHKARTINL